MDEEQLADRAIRIDGLQGRLIDPRAGEACAERTDVLRLDTAGFSLDLGRCRVIETIGKIWFDIGSGGASIGGEGFADRRR